MAAVPYEPLEQFLSHFELAWWIIPWERHCCLSNEWGTLYGNETHWLRQKQGAKAQYEYSQEKASTFLIVPYLGNIGWPHSLGKANTRPAAYECHGDGTLPDLSIFAVLDLFIVPDDWSWTMIHTHEDYEWGGPYFLRKDWLGLQGTRLYIGP
jgi:hypothetical protein